MEKIDIVVGNYGKGILKIFSELNNNCVTKIVAVDGYINKFMQLCIEDYSCPLLMDEREFLQPDKYQYRLWYSSMCTKECMMVGNFLFLLEQKEYIGKVQLYDVFRLTNGKRFIATIRDCNYKDVERLIKEGPEIATLPFNKRGPFCHFPIEWKKLICSSHIDSEKILFREGFFSTLEEDKIYKFLFKLISDKTNKVIGTNDLLSKVMLFEHKNRILDFGFLDSDSWKTIIHVLIPKGIAKRMGYDNEKGLCLRVLFKTYKDWELAKGMN